MIREIMMIGISAIAGGIVTIAIDRIRDRKIKKDDKQTKHAKTIENRPEFAITQMRDYLDKPGFRALSNTCDKELFIAPIKHADINDDKVNIVLFEEILDKESWVCVEYTMENIGKTSVYEVDIITNFMKDTCIYYKDVISEDLVKNSYLNYNILVDKRIGPNEEMSFKLCYHKDLVISGIISASLEIGMKDENGKFWVQPLFAPENKMYRSRNIKQKDYKRRISVELAYECFRKPYLW